MTYFRRLCKTRWVLHDIGHVCAFRKVKINTAPSAAIILSIDTSIFRNYATGQEGNTHFNVWIVLHHFLDSGKGKGGVS